ncbi:MAG: YggT family protein [Ramlibacter sp.]|jgi:YggT family protein
MLYQIVSLLLDVVIGLIGGACLLRLYMQHQRVPFGNPLGRFVFAVTDWLVLPLRRVLPSLGRWDTASVVGAWLLELLQVVLLWLLAGAASTAVMLPLVAVFGVVRLAISALTVLVIVSAVLSWVQASQGRSSITADILDRLSAPLLRPFRRVLPMVGGVDLSPLALLLVLQVAGIVLAAVQVSVLR